MKTAKELENWSRQNWNRIPELVREDCIKELKAHVPLEMLVYWMTEYQVGRAIGSNSPMFHMSTGMAIRNLLRNQYTDVELPPVKQEHLPDQPMAQNWDDFYLGALQDLVEREIKAAAG